MSLVTAEQREMLIDYIAQYRSEVEVLDSFFSLKLLYALIRRVPYIDDWTGVITKCLDDQTGDEVLATYLCWFDLMPNEYAEDAMVEQIILAGQKPRS